MGIRLGRPYPMNHAKSQYEKLSGQLQVEAGRVRRHGTTSGRQKELVTKVCLKPRHGERGPLPLLARRTGAGELRSVGQPCGTHRAIRA